MTDQLSGLRILVVEDEMLVLMSTEDMLADLGCETVAAATVDQALALMDVQRIDAAMVDMNLGGDKSFAIADALASCGVPFLFATGYVRDDVRDGHSNRPMLKKPYRPRELAEALTGLFASQG